MLKSPHARDPSDWEPTAFMRLRETVSETGDGTKNLIAHSRELNHRVSATLGGGETHHDNRGNTPFLQAQ